MANRPRALVTAPFRGEGMETLQSLADVVYDPWIEQVPLRLYNGEKLAARIEAEGADILIVESDFVKGPVFDLPAACASARAAATPTTSTSRPRPRPGSRCCARPGRNADAVAEITIALLFAVNRWLVPADHDVRAGEVYAGGKIPYQRYRAWQLAGRTVGHRRARRRRARRRSGASRASACACSSYDPYNPDATHNDDLDAMLAECDVVSMHAVVTPETERLMGAAQFAAMKPGAIYVNSARAMLHDTDALVARAAVGSPRRRRPRPLRGRAPRRPTIRCARCTTSCSRRTSAARPTTPKRTTRSSSPTTSPASSRGEKPVNCVNPEVLVVMAELKGTADEIKAELLWVAQESLRTNLVHGTAGNFSARLPDGNVVLTPSSLAYETMTLDDLVVCDLDGNVVEGNARPDDREDAAPRVPEGVRRHPRGHPLPRQVLHDVRDHPPADPVRDRRGRGVRRRRRAGRQLQVHRLAGARRRGVEVGRRPRRGADGQPRPAHRRQVAEGRAEDRQPRRAHRRDRVGRPRSSASSCRSPTRPAQKMAPIYKMLRGM